MHTAYQLQASMFALEQRGVPASLDEVLPDWNVDSRFGVVVDAPLGGLGASLLLQRAITAFFDCRLERRKPPPIYAEIIVVHAGGRFGSFAPMDVWPSRKEVFVAEPGAQVLSAINSAAVTHLAVPDVAPRKMAHHHKEAAAASDRLRTCYAYAPSGRVEGADTAIRALDVSLARDVDAVIDPRALLQRMRQLGEDREPALQADRAHFVSQLEGRRREVGDETRKAMQQIRAALTAPGCAFMETYRRLSVAAALARL